MGIGRVTLAEAKAEAMEANITIEGLRTKRRLVDRIEGVGQVTLGEWLTTFEGKLLKRDLAKNSKKTYQSTIRRIRSVMDESMKLREVRTKHCADAINKVAEKHARSAQQVRAMLFDAFNSAIAAGECESNPVTVTERVAVKVKRARLTFEVFMKVYKAQPPGRLKNAMALALVSGQPRESLIDAQFRQLGKEDGVECWKTMRGKTKVMIAIPLSLRLNVFGMSLGDVVKQCRASKIASPHMIHETVKGRGRNKLGSPMNIDVLTSEFSAAIAALDLDWGEYNPPTLHEVRSLCKRLYDRQGGVNTKELLGHKDEKTATLYADGRGHEYKLVSVQQVAVG